jgi:Flp pilus assembly protein TadG
MIRALFRCCRGAAIVEFALIAPVFLMAILGIIEVSRLLWTQQTLDEVAYSAARCMSVSSSCASTATQRNYAVARAGGYGITLASNQVTPVAATNCKGFPNSSSVTITHSFVSPLSGFVPGFLMNISSQACYPTIS